MAFFTDTWGSQWCPDHPCLSLFLFASLLCSFLLLPYICNELESCLYHQFHSLSNFFFMFLSVAFNCPPEFRRDERKHVPFRIRSALVVILVRHKMYLFCISMAEDCEMFWYLMDSTGWKMEKLVPFLSELLLQRLPFQPMTSWCLVLPQHLPLTSRACLSLAPFLFWMGYLKSKEPGIPGRLSGVLAHQQF